MANSKSAKKRMLVSGKKSMRNRMIKSRTRTAVKRAVTAMDSGSSASKEDAQAAFTAAVSLIDKARTKGVIHKNTAARRKSRLAKMMNKTAS